MRLKHLKYKIDLFRLKRHYAKHKKDILKHILIGIGYLLASMAVVGFRVLYPFHLFLALPLFFLGTARFRAALLFSKHGVVTSYTFKQSRHFAIRHLVGIVLTGVLLTFIYVLFTVLPQSENPFENMSNSEIEELVIKDIQHATVLMDNLEMTGTELLSSPLLLKDTLSADERAKLRLHWNNFLFTSRETETLTDVHQYFNKISYIHNRTAYLQSFMISYSLYMKKYALFHSLINRIHGNELLVKMFNEHSEVFEGKNAYTDILNRFFAHDTVLKRVLGRVYMNMFSLTTNKEEFSDSYFILRNEAEKSSNYLLGNIFNFAVNAARKQAYDIEHTLFGAWFPVQKGVANTMGNIYISPREEKLISIKQIVTMQKEMLPGDIMVQRRNWYVSNVGIPGFWPHSALYIGTLKESSAYFAELFPYNGHQTFETLLQAEFPEMLKKYRKVDEKGYILSVLEGKAPGIILQSLEKSAHADYVGVLRPILSKTNVLASLLRAFENYGKPYDYNFDFETRDELVCSELVYDAYIPMQEKRGLTLTLTETAGRKMVSPTDMVKKYFEEREQENSELTFVYFLDGNEELGAALVNTEEAFATSWQRSKYSWSLE